jgi:hypothetical protein
LVLELGDEVEAYLEMMSGALWVRDQLLACGWQVQVAGNVMKKGLLAGDTLR